MNFDKKYEFSNYNVDVNFKIAFQKSKSYFVNKSVNLKFEFDFWYEFSFESINFILACKFKQNYMT